MAGPQPESQGEAEARPALAESIIATMARRRPTWVLRYGVTVAVLSATAAIQTVVPFHRGPYLLLTPPVFIIGLMFGFGEGVLAAALATVFADYLFLGAGARVRLDVADLTVSFLFFGFSTLMVTVCDAVRRAALRQRVQLERSQALKAAAEASAQALAASREALARLNETLEQKVEERTAALEAAHEALRQSQKMEAVGQLTGGVAHDFNNLLAGVVGGLDLARRRLEEGRTAEAPRYLDIAYEAAERGAALTRRLLAFARREARDPEALALDQVVLGMKELVERTVGPGVALTLQIESALWALADRSELEGAVLNLAINARDAMAGRGRLVVSLRGRRLDPAEAAALAMPAGEIVEIAVTDDGCGMEAEVASRAFEPFFTTKPPGRGTGLGLAMVYAFATQAGGLARIESRPGEGATIRLLLPRSAPPAKVAAAPEAVPSSLASGASRGVLVVDDEPAIRLVTAEALAAAGFRVEVVADASEALERLARDPRPDLLVTDLGLAGPMNGRQLWDAAHLRWPSLRVLFITGFADAEIEALLDPVHPRLRKPFPMEALCRASVEVLAG